MHWLIRSAPSDKDKGKDDWRRRHLYFKTYVLYLDAIFA